MKHENSNSYQSSFGTIVRINGKLLAAFSFTFIGWMIYPSKAIDWGWGFLAICLFLSAFGLFVEALRAMTQLFVRDRALKKYMAQGDRPKSAELASDDALKNSEMIDD